MEVCDYNHLILYAKGWYKETNVLDDVRAIVAQRCALDLEHVSARDAWECVVRAFYLHSRPGDVSRILLDLFKPWPGEKNFTRSFWSDTCDVSGAIRRALSTLAQLRVTDSIGETILELGEPDPAVLPLKNEVKCEDCGTS